MVMLLFNSIIIGVELTKRIIMQSVEISHNIGIGMLVFELHSFQYRGEYFVSLENVIATNNSCP